jgi:hypothetical protein
MNDYFQTFEFHDTSFRKVLKCKPYINDFSQYPYLLKYKFTIKDFRDILVYVFHDVEKPKERKFNITLQI